MWVEGCDGRNNRYDREIFFGHVREIAELYHPVFESRLLLVYGISGIGKSFMFLTGFANY